MKRMHLRYWAVIVLLAAAVLVLDTRGATDRIVPREALAYFPEQIGGWTGSNLSINPEVLSVLGPGDFLMRNYTAPGSLRAINLFIAYFPSQRTGDTIHSPLNCLPGSGWTFQYSKYVNLRDARGKEHRVGEYVITNAGAKDFVIYWYQAHGRSVANEYAARAYMVADAIRLDRTDGALVRIVTSVDPNETVASARARAEAFTADVAPLLPAFIPN